MNIEVSLNLKRIKSSVFKKNPNLHYFIICNANQGLKILTESVLRTFR